MFCNIKKIVYVLIIILGINVIFFQTNKLIKKLSYDELSLNKNYISTSILYSDYINSDEYKLKIYINKAIEIMKSEDKNPSSKQIQKYLNIFEDTTGAWCTEFVVWSLMEADKELGTKYLDIIYPKRHSGYIAANWYQRHNRLHLEKDYIPKRGDMMFFKYYSDIIDHTAFVLGVEEKDGIIYVKTIEGNTPSLKNKGIVERIIPLTNKYIYGYGSYE